MKRKKKQPRRAKRAERRSARYQDMPILQYYELVFADLFKRLSDDLERALVTEPKDHRTAFWQEYSTQLLFGEVAWDALSRYATSLERRMAAIASGHSVYYWMHLYRRIGVELYPGHEQKIDPQTVGLVRLVAEAAFTRFGQLPHKYEDIRLSSEISPGNVLGGLFLDIYREHISPEAAEFFSRSLTTTPQWVLVQFSEDDFVNVFRVEGLAYEYWLTTARMRAIGKGGELRVSDSGNPSSVRCPDLEFLIQSYDQRTTKTPFQASAIGIGFGAVSQEDKPATVFAQYNINRLPLKASYPPADWVNLAPDLVTNFVYGGVNIASYLAGHAFADESFRAARGFRLSSLCVYLAAIVLLEYSQIKGTAREQLLGHGQLFQRAYVTTPHENYFQALKKTAQNLNFQWFGAGAVPLDDDAEPVVEYLTLRREKQCLVSLWSHGPRFAFIPSEDALVIDLHGFATILRNVFFRVKHDQGAKGPAFEDFFRHSASAAGLDVLPERRLRTTHGEREVDAAIRSHETLFLCECKAMELPLDVEIGRPKTLLARRQYFETYVQQAISAEELVRSHPVGRNYDFSWAKRVVSIVVSPFVEWVWTRDAELWLNDTVPRLLSVAEAIQFMLEGHLGDKAVAADTAPRRG